MRSELRRGEAPVRSQGRADAAWLAAAGRCTPLHTPRLSLLTSSLKSVDHEILDVNTQPWSFQSLHHMAGLNQWEHLTAAIDQWEAEMRHILCVGLIHW